MDLSGEYKIPAPKQRVWECLNAPEILKKSIKGCQTLDKISDNEFTAKVKAKIGPVSANFTGSVNLKDIDPPNSYIIEGQGKGGAAGFAKGSVKINLSENEDKTTTLTYSGKSQVGGKIAQLGSRLIGGAVKNTADDFFKNFCSLVSDTDVLQNNPNTNDETADKSKNDVVKYSMPYWVWITSLIMLILLIVFFFS